MINITLECQECNHKSSLSSINNKIEVSNFRDFIFHSPELTIIPEYEEDEYADHSIIKLECENCGNSIVIQDFYKEIT